MRIGGLGLNRNSVIIGEDEEQLGQPSFELVAGSSVGDLKNREMKNRETESNKMDETTYRGKIKNRNNEKLDFWHKEISLDKHRKKSENKNLKNFKKKQRQSLIYLQN